MDLECWGRGKSLLMRRVWLTASNGRACGLLEPAQAHPVRGLPGGPTDGRDQR
jgi:hypothetical protein